VVTTHLLAARTPAPARAGRPWHDRRDPDRPGDGPLVARRRRAGDDGERWARPADLVRALVWGLLAVALWQVWPQTVGGPMAYVRVSGTSMEPGLRTGDLVAVKRRDAYAVGDVVAYRVPEGEVGARQVVIHRLVAGDGRTGWVALGDNRRSVDPWRPTDEHVVGEMVWSSAGRGDDLQRLAEPVPLGLLCGGLTTLVLLWPDRRRRRGPAPVVPLVLDGLRLVPSLHPPEARPGRVVVRRVPGTGRATAVALPAVALPLGAVRGRPGTVRVVVGARTAVATGW
jgi:signal peptidase I